MVLGLLGLEAQSLELLIGPSRIIWAQKHTACVSSMFEMLLFGSAFLCGAKAPFLSYSSILRRDSYFPKCLRLLASAFSHYVLVWFKEYFMPLAFTGCKELLYS